jgi:hypothetical protein
MARIPFGPVPLDLCRCTTFLDSCAFDPKFEPETSAARDMLSLHEEQKIVLVITHSVESELEHPATPDHIKRLANDMNRTRLVELTDAEEAQLEEVKSILVGDARPGKHEADANHVFHAGKWRGYFVTTDERILNRRDALARASRSTILRPSEWMAAYSISLELP